jgi:drug/metabolite transporter (DMT)-like permease
MENRTKSILGVNLATLLFGFTGLFGKIFSFSPVLIVSGRTLVASVTLIVVILLKRQKFFAGNFASLEYFKYAGQGFLLAIVLVSSYKSIQVSTVAIGNLAYATFPIFVVFTESFFFKEKLKWKDFVSASLVVLGVAFMIPKFELGNSVMQGVLWGLLSGLTLAFLFVVRRKSVSSGNSSLVTTFYEQFFCFLFLLPLAVYFYDPVVMEMKNLGYLLLLGVFCSAYAYYLLISSLAHVKAKLAGIIISVEPVYGVVLAIVLLKEIPDWKTLIGGGVILFAAFYETMRSGKDRKEDLPLRVE